MAHGRVAPPADAPCQRRNALVGWGIRLAALVVAVVAFVGCQSSQPSTDPPPDTAQSAQVVLPFTGLQNPVGIAVDGAGAVYVADKDKVVKLGPGTAGQVALRFTGLDVAPNFTVDRAGAVYATGTFSLPSGVKNQVVRLAPDGGAEIALPFTGLGTQVDVVVDTTGNVYVVDSANPTQVWKLSPGAATPTELPFAGLDDSSTAAAVDAAGNLYITDHQADRDHPGAIRQQILKLIPGVTAPVPLTFTDLGMASGIAVDSGDNVYVTDTFNNRVLKLAPGAAGSNPLPFTGLKNPWGVAVDAAGNVYVADSGNDRVLKLPAQ